MTDRWEVVATYGAMYEAEMAAGRLESAGIASRIDQRGAVGLFGPGHLGRSVRGIALLVREGVVKPVPQGDFHCQQGRVLDSVFGLTGIGMQVV